MISIQTEASPIAAAALAAIARHDERPPPAPDDAGAEIEEETFADGVRRVRGADGRVVYVHPPLASPTTLPTPTPPTEGELRWALRRALADLDCAAARARNARKSVAHAAAMLSEVELALDDYRASAATAAESAGERLAKAIAEGTSDTFVASDAAAVDLVAIRAGQRRAEIQAAREHLVSDLERAETAHADANAGVVTARSAIVAHEVGGMVRRLLDLERQAAYLRRRLMVRSASSAPWPPVNTRIDASGPEFLSAIEFWKLYDEGLRKNPEFSLQNLLGENGV